MMIGKSDSDVPLCTPTLGRTVLVEPSGPFFYLASLCCIMDAPK